jgi:hypothetical protein
MDDLFLLIHSLMKLGLVVSILVLIATAPSTAAATAYLSRASSPDNVTTPSPAFDDDDDDRLDGASHENFDFESTSSMTIETIHPMVNIDGTPMVGDSDIDINGNPFGVTNDWHSADSWNCGGMSSSMFD